MMRTNRTCSPIALVVTLVTVGCLAAATTSCEDGSQDPTTEADQPPDQPPEAEKAVTGETAANGEKPENGEKAEEPAVALPDAPALAEVPDDYPPVTAPDDNPTTPEKAMLGELLFFDKRLSDKGELACVTCHLPDKGWTDGEVLSIKHDGKKNKRHSPTMYMVPYAQAWYWDGRKETLEAQILAAWTGQVGGTPETIAQNLAKVPVYQAHFERAFGEGPSKDNIPMALAAFIRGKFAVAPSPWDRFQAGDKKAVSSDAKKGFEVFTKAGCAACHAPPLFSDMAYHNTGVGYKGVKKPDLGRGEHTKEKADGGKFKTPTLRGVARSAPYFHDGSAATLEDAVDFMVGGGHKKKNKNLDKLLKKQKLSKKDKKRLLAFLEALTPDEDYQPPTLP